MIDNKDIARWKAAEMQYADDKAGYYAGLIFVVWPLLALVSAFRNYKSNWAKNVLWAFIAFYGYAFAIGAESQGSDIVRYVAEVEYLHGIPMSFSDMINYYQQSGEIDILRTFLAIVVSRFTDSQAVLTLVYGTIFGFFFSRNIWYLLERLKGKIEYITLLLLICFFLVVPFWYINSFRMWTAAHIFIYGLLPYLFEGKKKGVFIATLSILVHFSFLVPLGVLYGYMFLGNKLVFYFCFFLATFFISEIDISTFNNLIENYAPEVIQERTSSYRSVQQVEQFREDSGSNRVWYARWYGRVLKWSVMGFLIVLFIRGRKFFSNNKYWLSLFSFVLLFYGVANLFSSLPSGSRFVSVANLIALALITLYVQNREQGKVMKRLILLATPALLLFVVVSVRIALYSLSATAILGNPIVAALFTGEHISLNDVLKMII